MPRKILDFWSFLNEEKNSSVIEIAMFIGGDSNDTSSSFESECSKKNIKFHTINTPEAYLESVDGGHIVVIGNKKIRISQDKTAILIRSGVLKSTQSRDIAQQLEDAGYFIINSLKSIEVCEDKFVTGQYLEKAGLPTPRTSLLTNEDDIDRGLAAIGGEFPLVMKLLKGSKGIGVSIVDSYDSLKSVYQTIKKLDPEGEVLIQEKIDASSDYRIHILINKFSSRFNENNFTIIGSMRRGASDKGFRTNYSLGGSVSKLTITKELEELVYKAANTVGCIWAGVDIMIDKKTKKPYILEVNSSPGTEGISKVLGSPIVDKVIKFITDKDNWKYSPTEVGYMETMHVEGLGDVVALFDTGNGGTTCSLHADKIEEKNGILHWSIGHIKFSKKIVGELEVFAGANNSKIKEDRFVVLMDMKFIGIKLKDIEVSIVGRERKAAPLLINRKIMKQLNLQVNPNDIFIATERFDPDFTPQDARGDSHAGIKALMKKTKK